MRTFYSTLRATHLYLGLFVSPFLLVFALSVIFLVHAWLPGARGETQRRTVDHIAFPADLETRQGRAQVDAAREVLTRLGVDGEIGFVRQFPRERRFVIPVTLPGREATVELRLPEKSATVTTRTTGWADAMVYLHKMPGPHNVALRGNSAPIAAWRWFADATVYALLLVTASGLYLWAVLKSERRLGLIILAAGVITFSGMLYGLV